MTACSSCSDDSEASAQIQFYQSDNQYDAIDIYNTSTNSQTLVGALTIDTFSQLIPITSGTHTLTTTFAEQPDAILQKNHLITLNEGESKLVVFYPDDEQQSQSLSFHKQQRPLAFDNAINLLNLASGLDDINVYFVESWENLDTTQNRIKSLKFAHNKLFNLQQTEYQIYVTNNQDNGSEQPLFQSASLPVCQSVLRCEAELFIVEPDEQEFSGYRLNIVAE